MRAPTISLVEDLTGESEGPLWDSETYQGELQGQPQERRSEPGSDDSEVVLNIELLNKLGSFSKVAINKLYARAQARVQASNTIPTVSPFNLFLSKSLYGFPMDARICSQSLHTR